MFRQNLSVMFLGTASGGGPSDTRNCSSLVCDFMDDLSLWLVDCAEGTLRQFQLQPQEGFKYRAHKVSKIFITHMHADHIMGIVPFLRTVLHPPTAGTLPAYGGMENTPPRVEIYGPAGIRQFVRQIMKMTFTFTGEPYVVHELLGCDDPVTPCELPDLSAPFDQHVALPNIMHVTEQPGSDIRADQNGFWINLVSGMGRVCNIEVDAGSIEHRDPCLGYVFRETAKPHRKVVILGDTYDPMQIVPLCINPSPQLLVHECTDAPIPASVDPEGKLSKRVPEEVVKKAILRGHSVPAMAGEFAKKIGAENLVLNHIGGRFPAPRHQWDSRAAIMRDIERQTTEAWGGGSSNSAVAAVDFLRVNIPVLGHAQFQRPPPLLAGSTHPGPTAHNTSFASGPAPPYTGFGNSPNYRGRGGYARGGPSRGIHGQAGPSPHPGWGRGFHSRGGHPNYRGGHQNIPDWSSHDDSASVASSSTAVNPESVDQYFSSRDASDDGAKKRRR